MTKPADPYCLSDRFSAHCGMHKRLTSIMSDAATPKTRAEEETAGYIWQAIDF